MDTQTVSSEEEVRFGDAFRRGMALVRTLREAGNGPIFLSLDTGHSVKVSFFPDNGSRYEAAKIGMRLCQGKMGKSQTFGTLTGRTDVGDTVTIFHVLVCSKVGEVVRTEPVLAPTGEVRDVVEPITECRVIREEEDA